MRRESQIHVHARDSVNNRDDKTCQVCTEHHIIDLSLPKEDAHGN